MSALVGLVAALAANELQRVGAVEPALRSVSVSSDGARDALGIQWLPESVAAWAPDIVAAGTRHSVAPELVAIVALVESGGHPQAVSPSGARGLMQVMPATADDIARQRGMDANALDLGDPVQNIDLGAWYLADQLKRFGRAPDEDWQASVALAAAAYNGGPGRVERHIADGEPLPAETQRYQTWVLGMWRERSQAKSPSFEHWLAAGGWRLVDAASASTLAYANSAPLTGADVTGLAP